MNDYPYLERVVAAIIDSIIISVLSTLIFLPTFIIAIIPFFPATIDLLSGIDEGMIESDPRSAILSLLWMLAVLLVALLFLFILHYYWYVTRPVKNDGQTYGKSVMKVKVVRTDGQTLTKSTMFWRYVAMMLIIQFIGPFIYITIFFDDEKRAIYDLIAGTKVVRA